MRVKDEKKFEAISQAAIHLIITEGLSGASMSKIAKQAGVSAATIYIYFTNKEEMLSELYRNCKLKMSIDLLHNVDTDGDVEKGLRQLWRNLYRYIPDHAEEFSFLEQFENSPHVEKICKEMIENEFKPLFTMIERGKELGVIKNLPHEMIRAFGFFPIIRLTKEELLGNLTLTEELLEQAFDLAWNSLKA
jgi:AcrR family transcriptional regulator